MDKLNALRKEQKDSGKVGNVNYESLLGPFYFRAGDHLATYIMMNTDEFGNVKPFSEEPDSEADEAEDAAADGAEGEGEANAKEESKQEEAPQQDEAPKTMMINTSAPAAAPAAEDQNAVANENGQGGGEANDENYEQMALDYLSLALQIIGDFSGAETCLEA